ncbi:hypothetical protein NDU88_002877 [Pleurodeles waltl]|uniref:Uncharacterized protein n=1 Tax=Pleurodeles waltl TaxID=8319 RepID=A0AAV7WMG4_PLEWA|nr:hypothetical protein NDU88_002877 [Pleurodeles waltl]
MQKTPRQPKKTPLCGGTERRRNRYRQKPWKTAADPGEPNERAATLQEKRGFSRYRVRDKGNRAGGGRYEKGQERDNKGERHGEHWEEGKAKGGARHGEHWEERRQTESEKEKNSEESDAPFADWETYILHIYLPLAGALVAYIQTVVPGTQSVDGAPAGTAESPDGTEKTALSQAFLMAVTQGAYTKFAHKIDFVAIDNNLLHTDLHKVTEQLMTTEQNFSALQQEA